MMRQKKKIFLFLLTVFIHSTFSLSAEDRTSSLEALEQTLHVDDTEETNEEEHLSFRTRPLKLALWLFFVTLHYFLSFDVDWVGVHYGGDICTDKHRHHFLPTVQGSLSTYIMHHFPHIDTKDFVKDPLERMASGLISRSTADDATRLFWSQGNYSFFDSLMAREEEEKTLVDISDEKSLPLQRGDILIASPLTFQVQSRLSLYLVQHWGVYLGQGFIMESDGSNYVWFSPLEKNQDYLVMRLTGTSSQQEIIRRARQSLGTGPESLGYYTPLFSNCQHFSTWLATGRARSPLAGAILLGYFGGNVVLFLIDKKYRKVLFKRWQRRIRSHRWQ